MADTASAYDIRYSTAPIDDSNWLSANQCHGEPVPLPPGSTETYVVDGLLSETTYYFVLKVADEASNWSDISNSLEAATLAPGFDGIRPAAIFDLEGVKHDAERVRLRWTAPGDDGYEGVAEAYDIRYHTSPIDASNWRTATQVSGEPDPGTPGTIQEIIVEGLGMAGQCHFAIRTRDEEPNWSDISNIVFIDMPRCTWSMPWWASHWSRDGEVEPGVIRLYWSFCLSCGSTLPETYDIRYSTSPIDDWNWHLARRCSGQPIMEQNGHLIVYGDYYYWIRGLAPATTYYIGIRGARGNCVTPIRFCSVTTGPAIE
jgi:hypothetical protein